MVLCRARLSHCQYKDELRTSLRCPVDSLDYFYCSSTDRMHSSSTRLPHSTSLRPCYSSLWTLSSQVMPCSLSRSLVSPTNSPVKKREVDWVEFAFAKPSGTVARDTKKNWPIADRRVTSNNPRNNCVTYFGSRSLLVSKVANCITCRVSNDDVKSL